MPDPSSFSLPPEDRARMLAAMAGAIDGGFWTSPDGNSGGSPGEIATAMLCALEPLLAERWDGLKEACRREMAHHFALPDAELAAERDQARAEARGLREALEGLRDLRAISFISTQHALDSYVDAVQRRVDAALSASLDTEVRGHGRDRHGVLAPGRVVGVGPDPCPVPDEDEDSVSVPEQEEGRGEVGRGGSGEGKDAAMEAAAEMRHASSVGSTFGTGSTTRTTRPVRLPDSTPKAAAPDLAAASFSSSEEGERAPVEVVRSLLVDLRYDPTLAGTLASLVVRALNGWMRERLTSDEAVKAWRAAAGYLPAWGPTTGADDVIRRRLERFAAALSARKDGE